MDQTQKTSVLSTPQNKLAVMCKFYNISSCHESGDNNTVCVMCLNNRSCVWQLIPALYSVELKYGWERIISGLWTLEKDCGPQVTSGAEEGCTHIQDNLALLLYSRVKCQLLTSSFCLTYSSAVGQRKWPNLALNFLFQYSVSKKKNS